MNPEYKLYHPKWYRERMPIFWWLEKLSYVKFIVRELTSLAVGYAAVLLTVQVWMAGRGEEARFTRFLQSPPVLIFHTLVFAALLFHSVTWLNLAPKAMVVRIGHRQVPPPIVLIAHYLAWLAASALLIWFFIWRR